MNQTEQIMKTTALERLQKHMPEDIAERCNLIYEKNRQCFRFSGLFGDILIQYPSFKISPTPDFWYEIVLLHYLDFCDGSAGGEQYLPLAVFKDGTVRGSDFDRKCMIADFCRGVEEKTVKEACFALGGKETEGKGDLNVIFPVLPKYRLLLRIWFEDDELPPSGVLLFREGADHYLSMEDSVVIGEWLMTSLRDKIKMMTN